METMSTSQDLEENSDQQQVNYVRPRILLTGLRRSGKTSIQRVIFTKMQPAQTQFLETTPRLTTNQFSCGSFINFQIQELPGQLHIFPSSNPSSNASGQENQVYSSYDENSGHFTGGYDMERLLKNSHAVVYIIDAQDDYSEAVSRLMMIIEVGRRVNPKLRYEVFIHKVDQLSDESKYETQRDIHDQVRNRFTDPSIGIEQWPLVPNANAQDILINFHLTSIFDHSIFEAFSKVIQKLLPQFSQLEFLLNHLLSLSNIEQAFLFDVQTKISIASDSSPTDMQMYELCCDMIDLLLHMSEIYGQPRVNQETNFESGGEEEEEEVDQEYSEEYDDEEDPADHEYLNGDRSLSKGTSRTRRRKRSRSAPFETSDDPASNVFDSMSSSVIKLNCGRALYLREVNRHLALICILREEALLKQALIDYNVRQIKESMLKLIQLTPETATPSPSTSDLIR